MDKIKAIIGKFRPYNKVRTPVFLQQSETECGIAALAILFSYFRYYVPFEMLREQCGTSRDGCKALTLMNVARTHGFIVDAFKIDVKDLYPLELPVIAFWNFSHYVVINGIGTDKVFLNDPAHGSYAVSLKIFDKAFTGIIIVLRPGSAMQSTAKPAVFWPMLSQWSHSYYSELIYLFLLVLIGMAGTLGQAVYSNLILVDYHEFHANSLMLEVLFFVSGGVFFSYFAMIQKWHQFLLCANASFSKSVTIINHVLALPFIFYTLRQKSEIVAVLNRCDFIVNLIYKNMIQLGTHVFMLLACLLMMYNINQYMTYVSAITTVMTALSLLLAAKAKQMYEKTSAYLQGKLDAHLITSIKNIETIIACGFETDILKKWQNLFVKKLINHYKSTSIKSLLHVAQIGNHHISIIVIFYLAMLQIEHGKLTIEWLMPYYFLHEYLSSLINTIVHALQDIQSAHASHVRINDMMKYPVDRRYFINKRLLKISQAPLLSCRDVCFFYNKTQPPTLINISGEIALGEHIGIVGSTGSGKSTLAKLLAALYQPHAGQIRLHGYPLTYYNAHTLAKKIAYVPQDAGIFPGTLWDNITLWQQTLSPRQVEDAIYDACLEEVIADRGLRAYVGEEGNALSGGEKQRIEIARALLQETPLIIFDEATAALDAQTESCIMNRLKRREKTIIFITHRLSAIQQADQIWVMEQGNIIAQDKHDQLIVNNKTYQALWHYGELL